MVRGWMGLLIAEFTREALRKQIELLSVSFLYLLNSKVYELLFFQSRYNIDLSK